jgi:carotenoid cleavage dioxygenase-like enzyme
MSNHWSFIPAPLSVAAFTPLSLDSITAASFASKCSAYTRAERCCALRTPTRAVLSEHASASGVGRGLVTVEETPSPIALSVSGSIPTWLRGELTRVGPAVFEAPAKDSSLVRFEHWFDGIPFLHKFVIQPDGGVSYSSRNVGRHVESAIASAQSRTAYRAVTVGTVIDPCRSFFSKVFTMFQPLTTDPNTPGAPPYPVGVAIERRGGAIGMPLALTTDAATFLAVNPETLEPERFVSYGDLGVRDELAAAHGHYDEVEGAYYNFVSSISKPKAPISIVRIKDGAATIVAKTPSVPSAYIHSFAMTGNYVVIVVGSARTDGLKMLRELCFLSGMKFDSSADTQFYVIDRRRGSFVTSYSANPCFFFHVANAFETPNGSIVIDICRYEDAQVFEAFNVKNMCGSRSKGEFPEARLTRFTLPSVEARKDSTMRATERVLANSPVDLPSINNLYRRKDYQYAYAVSMNNSKDLFSAVAKVDVKCGDTIRYSAAGRYPSEPVFVANPESTSGSEDEGVVVFVELDTNDAAPKSALVVLDAASMEEVARCETPIGKVVPFTFHGNFATEEDLDL